MKKYSVDNALKKESSEIPLALDYGLNGECRIYNYE